MKLLLFSVALFSFGFLANAFLFQKNPAQITALSQQNVLGTKESDQFITYINYDGNDFEPNSVVVTKGNYISITNSSKEKLMWLVSDNPDLSTSRGYGEGERLQLTLQKSGEFQITNKLNLKARATIFVKEVLKP